MLGFGEGEKGEGRKEVGVGSVRWEGGAISALVGGGVWFIHFTTLRFARTLHFLYSIPAKEFTFKQLIQSPDPCFRGERSKEVWW